MRARLFGLTPHTRAALCTRHKAYRVPIPITLLVDNGRIVGS